MKTAIATEEPTRLGAIVCTDDAEISAQTCPSLESRGYAVICEPEGETATLVFEMFEILEPAYFPEADSCLPKLRISLAILDLANPFADCIDFLRTIRKYEDERTHVVLIVNNENERETYATANPRPDTILVKPFDIHQLLAAI